MAKKKKSKSKEKPKAAQPANKKRDMEQQKIVIDEKRGLVFSSEEEIYERFYDEIMQFENEYKEWRSETDLPPEDFSENEYFLTELLQNPDEVWFTDELFDDVPVATFMGQFVVEDEEELEEGEDDSFYYVALTYFAEDTPKFVFIHFPTNDPKMLDKFRRGEKIYQKNYDFDALTESIDALSEGDEFAKNLYEAMLTLRSKNDISESDFEDYKKFREETIEEPDEVWKNTDSQGNTLVRFMKALPEFDGSVTYIVTTLEEESSDSQYLLFSFPTNDPQLVERYKQGECLEAVSFTREESH